MKQYIFRLLLLLPCSIFSLPLVAQLSMGGHPSNITSQQSLRAGYALSSPVVQVEAPAMQDIEEQLTDESRLWGKMRGLYRIGLPQQVDISPENSGMITRGEQGNLIWQVVIESAGARHLQLFFSQFEMEEGSKLFLISPDHNIIRGAYGAHNNNPTKRLSMAPIEGSRIVVRYEGAPAKDALPKLRIGQVNYGFRSLDHETANDYNKGEPWFTTAGLACAPNAVKLPDYEKQSRSLLLAITKDGVVFSAALINNTAQDGTPYILSAAHCFNEAYTQNSPQFRKEVAEGSVFYFNFRSPTGDIMTRPTEDQTLSGAEIVAWNEEHDLCLLKITGLQQNPETNKAEIPASYRPYFSGWNVSEEHRPPYFGLHHPKAATARFNQCKESIRITNFSVTTKSWRRAHFKIDSWAIGTTAGGSSGSPLYDSEQYIIGALTGGASYCDAPYNDYYYALSRCYSLPNEDANASLVAWLDPLSTGQLKLKGLEWGGATAAQRLSHNLYSVDRDDIEQDTTPYLKQLSGVASAYPIANSVRLLGVKVVAKTDRNSFPESHLVIYQGNNTTPEKILSIVPIKHPFFGDASLQQERTLGGLIDFFVPIQDRVILPNKSTLYVAIVADPNDANKSLDLSIVRTNPQKKRGNSTLILPLGKKTWQHADAKELPESLHYRGDFWIDAVVQSTTDSTDIDPSKDDDFMPLVNVYSDRARIILPSNDKKEARIFFYDLRGHCLLSVKTSQLVTDVALPNLPKNEHLVITVLYNDRRKSLLF